MSSSGFYALTVRLSTKVAKISKLPGLRFTHYCLYTMFSAGFISCCLVFSVGKTILFAKFWCGGWWCDLAMCMALCVGYLINLICKFRLKNNTSFLPLFFIIQKWKYRFLLLRCLRQSIFVREQLHRLDRRSEERRVGKECRSRW